MKWIAALGIGLGLAVSCIDFSIVNTSIYPIQEGLNATLIQMIWVMNAFGIMSGVLLVTMGRIADIWGRKRVFCLGLLIFAFGALIAGFAPSIHWLIFARGIQGVANAILLTVSVTLITHAFPKHEHHLAVGLWSAMNGLFFAIGPILGVALVTNFGWRSIFFIDIPLIIVSLIFISFSVQESKNEEEPRQLDWRGFIFLTGGLFSLVYALLEGPKNGWTTFVPIIGILISSAFFLALFASEKKTQYPIIKFRLFKNRDFLFCAALNSVLVYYVWSAFFTIPLFLHKYYQLSNNQVGVTLLFLTIPLMITSIIGGFLSKKVDQLSLIIFGSVLLIVSTTLQVSIDPSSLISMYGALSAFGVGWGIVWSAIMSRGISSLPKNMAGVATGGWMTVQEVFGCLGLAITGSLMRAYSGDFLFAYRIAFAIITVLLIIAFLGILFFINSKNKEIRQK